MLPTRAVRLQLGELLGADATTLAPVAANKIALIAADFTPDENLVLGDLTLATFTGSAPKAGATGAQGVGIDPLTGDQVITILPPAGGYLFECTVAPGAPETIFGYALVDNAAAVLLGVVKFPDAFTIENVGDQVDCGNPTMRLVAQPIE